MSRMFFTAIIIGGLVLLSVSFGYSGGSGTPQEPYQIASKADLLSLAAASEDYNKCFILTADIDLEGQLFTAAVIAEDTVAGGSFSGTAFTGTFDGNGHKITNFTINGESNYYLGLFGCISSGGAVKNLGLENFAVSDSSGSYCVGGLAGLNYGGITNSYSTGSVGDAYDIGGLVGDNYGSITNSYSTGSVGGYGEVGGLVGINDGNISNCHSTSMVNSASGYQHVGGLVGANTSSITNSYSTGNVGYSSYVGGLVGFNVNGSITNCYSTGTASGSSRVGGLAGYNSSRISNCYSIGAASGTSYAGGLVGRNWLGSITNSYSTGTASGSSYVGGLVGSRSGGSISACYFLDTSGPINGYGTPLTDEQMKQQANFIGWDFVGETTNGTENIWRMCIDGLNYPLLWWQFNIADFTCPDGVNMKDLDYFVQRWLFVDCASSNNCDGTDMNGSGTVDFADFAIFAQYWLQYE